MDGPDRGGAAERVGLGAAILARAAPLVLAIGVRTAVELNGVMGSPSFGQDNSIRSLHGGGSVVAAEHTDDDALDPAAIGFDIAWGHGVIGRLETDTRAFAVEAFEGGFAGVQERDDLFAVAGGFAAFNDDEIAVAEMIFDHGIAAHAQDIDAVARAKKLFEVDLFAVFDGFDGRAGGDIAQERELGGSVFVGKFFRGDDFQGPGLVFIAAQDAFALQGADMLEDGDFAGSELVGQFLHGGGHAVEMPVISDGHDDIKLPGSEIHKTALNE